MAIKNTVVVAMKNGLDIPTGNTFTTKIHTWSDPQYDENRVYTGVKRYISYDLFPYKTEADIVTDGVEFISGEMVDVPNGWTKEMSPAEYAALLADGTLAEVWLKDQFNIWLAGNAATVVDPY